GRHAHATAAGGVPGRGHLRPPPSGRERAGTAGPDRRRAAKRPLPRPRARGGGRVSSPAFELPARLEAHEPPEARGLRRDRVRLMIASRGAGAIVHTRFDELPSFLLAGDLLVVNTSATLPAALSARRRDGTRLQLRLSTPSPGQPGDHWGVELRLGHPPFRDAQAGDALELPPGRQAAILPPHPT